MFRRCSPYRPVDKSSASRPFSIKTGGRLHVARSRCRRATADVAAVTRQSDSSPVSCGRLPLCQLAVSEYRALPHARSSLGFANRGRVDQIVFLPNHVRFHIDFQDKTRIVSERLDLAGSRTARRDGLPCRRDTEARRRTRFAGRPSPTIFVPIIPCERGIRASRNALDRAPFNIAFLCRWRWSPGSLADAYPCGRTE